MPEYQDPIQSNFPTRHSYPAIIAVDGPAASGKSTIGRMLAEKLGYLFFDTGIMYRAITWIALQRGIPPNDEARISSLAEEIEINILPPSLTDGRSSDIQADGKEITWQIRRPEVDANVSVVSAYPAVRRAMTAQQRRIGMRGRVVMVGRDIGTIVLPEADLKIYLDASPEERARRRYQENILRAEPADLAEILESVRKRDQIDSSRELAPLRPADDAIVVNTDHMDISQVFNTILELVEDRSREP